MKKKMLPVLIIWAIILAFITGVESNNDPPKCSGQHWDITLPENTASNPSPKTDMEIQVIRCQSGDGSTVRYKMIEEIFKATIFLLGETLAGDKVIKQKANTELNYRESPYFITIEIYHDGGNGLTITETFTLIVESSNVPPVCPNVGPVTLSETSEASPAPTIDTLINNLGCTDKDSDPIFYFIISGANNKFSISSTGDVMRKANSVLDYDTASVTTKYVLEVGVSDGKGTTTVTFTINLSPVNEHPPSFSVYTVTTIEVSETTTVQSQLIRFYATDADKAPHAVASYDILSVTNGGSPYFTIDSSGNVKSNQLFDYEATKVYELTIEAKDGGSPAKSSSATLTVSITDTNDNPPVCTNSPLSASVVENFPAGPISASVLTSDADSSLDNNNVIQYSITAGDTSGKFNVDATSGSLSTTSTLDYETTQSYTLKVQARDGAGSGPNSVTCTVNVVVVNSNEFPPSCTPSTYSANVPENSPTLHTIGNITCTDNDSGTTLAYSVVTVDGAPGSTGYTMDGATLKAANPVSLDYETAVSHQVGIKVSDQFTGSPKSITQMFTVNVVAVNEAKPTFVASPVRVKENSQPNTVVATLTATDSDVGGPNHGNITWSIESGNSDNKFTIASNGDLIGNVKTAGALSRADVASYNLTIKATDGGGLFGTQFLSITVIPVNTHAPVAIATVIPLNVAEDQALNTDIIDLMNPVIFTDADTDPPNNEITYSIAVTGLAPNPFTLIGTKIKKTAATSKALSSYTIDVTARDGGSPQFSAKTQLRITINDGPPRFNSSAAINVPENTNIDAVIHTVICHDPDNASTPAGVFTLAITGGNTGSAFSLMETGPKMGELKLRKALDYEKVSERTFTLTIAVTDKGSPPRSSNQDLVVSVTEVKSFFERPEGIATIAIIVVLVLCVIIAPTAYYCVKKNRKAITPSDQFENPQNVTTVGESAGTPGGK